MPLTYTEQMQRIWRLYEEAGMPTPASKYDVAAWAIKSGLWEPQPTTVISQCADDLAKALQAEYLVDEKGRKYRTKHAVRVDSGGVQMTLWADIEKAPISHMVKSLSQRRRKLVGMAFQLKTDADVTSEKHPEHPPIRPPMNFTNDVSELEAMRDANKLEELDEDTGLPG